MRILSSPAFGGVSIQDFDHSNSYGALHVCVCVCVCVCVRARACTLSRSNSYGALRVCVCVCAHVHAQSCPTLCNSTDYSLPGSSVLGIFQERILEWVAISSSRVSNLHLWHLLHWQAASLPLSHLESPV